MKYTIIILLPYVLMFLVAAVADIEFHVVFVIASLIAFVGNKVLDIIEKRKRA